MRSILLPALRYFGLTFAAGFVLGIVRTLWLVPQLGERAAELLELPVMVAISFAAASLMLRKRVGLDLKRRLAIGLTALSMLLLAEVGVVVLVGKQSLAENLAQRDPIAGAAYLAALLIFAAAPALLLVLRRRPGHRKA